MRGLVPKPCAGLERGSCARVLCAGLVRRLFVSCFIWKQNPKLNPGSGSLVRGLVTCLVRPCARVSVAWAPRPGSHSLGPDQTRHLRGMWPCAEALCATRPSLVTKPCGAQDRVTRLLLGRSLVRALCPSSFSKESLVRALCDVFFDSVFFG